MVSSSSIDGLISGLSTTDIISQLMSLERRPQQALQGMLGDDKVIITAYQSINSGMLGISTAAAKLNTVSGWNVFKATSSSTNVTATASAGALGGSLSFAVNRLATNAAFVSSGSVASTAAVITSGNLLVAKGGSSLGIASVAGSGGLALGGHAVSVTQASSGASRTGTAALAASTTITAGVNDTLTADVDGASQTFTLAAGTYTAAQLAAAVGTASAGTIAASIDNTNHLVLGTAAEGSTHSLGISGGTARTALGLAVDGAAVAGTDGVVSVDGTTTTLTDIRAGGNASLASGTGGTITATFSGGLRVGNLASANVSTGDGSLGSVVNAVNSANVGVTASAVQVAPGQLRLQLRSATSGSAGALSVDSTALAGIGTMQTLDVGQDAQITIGSGPAAYTVTSSSNTLSSVLPGVTLSLTKADPLTTVTVDVGADASGLADKIQALVEAGNSAIATIQKSSSYNQATKSGGILLGDSIVLTLQANIQNAVADAVGASSLGSAGLAGVQLTREGDLQFDRDKFISAYNANPAAVASLFQRGGTTTSSKVAFLSSSDGTQAGTYAVAVTQAATQAQVTGGVIGGGTISSAETIDLQVGSTVATYAAAAGSDLATIAAGLTAAAAQQGLGLAATVVGGALQISSTGFGVAASFQVRSTASGAGSTGLVSSAGTYEGHSGLDVIGTINGQAATGAGQILTAAASATGGSAGISLLISATAADVSVSTDFGTFTYTPGVAQRLALVASAATNSVNGSLTSAIAGRNTEVSRLGTQISAWDDRLAVKQLSLQRQFANLETTLGKLRDQSTWLAGQLNTLPRSQ